jgi:glycosyltransferase involved in cell wall biosynthesis
VSDIPEILDGCGKIVAAEDPAALESGLADLLDDAAEAARLGSAARERCIDRYSWDAMGRTLDAEFDRLSR